MPRYNVQAKEEWAYSLEADTLEEAKRKVEEEAYRLKVEMLGFEIESIEEVENA
jgi:hypothetical protein